jgi:hypothetical protein
MRCGPTARDDGSTARCETKGKKVTAPAYPTAFPLRDVREALAGSTETVRKFFLRMAAGGVTRQDVEVRIPAPYRDLFAQCISATPITTPPADLILYALERSKSRARELNAEAKASAAVVSETTAGIEAVSGSDLELARGASASARSRAEHSRLGAAKDRVGDVRPRNRRANAEAKRAGIPPPPRPIAFAVAVGSCLAQKKELARAPAVQRGRGAYPRPNPRVDNAIHAFSDRAPTSVEENTPSSGRAGNATARAPLATCEATREWRTCRHSTSTDTRTVAGSTARRRQRKSRASSVIRS